MRRRSQVMFERQTFEQSTSGDGRRTSLTPFAQLLLGSNADAPTSSSGADAVEMLHGVACMPSYLSLAVGAHGECGYRRTMEDEHVSSLTLRCQQSLPPSKFFGVFDGHGGGECSKYLKRHMISEIELALNGLKLDSTGLVSDDLIKEVLFDTFLKVDEDFLRKCAEEHYSNVGSTVTSVLVVGNRLYCANTGDARTVLSRGGVAVPLSRDHKPGEESEERRINDAGGKVFSSRIYGVLAVSRAFGDADFKLGCEWLREYNVTANLVLADPEIEVTQLTDNDEFIILACDGLWDVMSNQDAVDWVSNQICCGKSCEEIAKDLCNKAIHGLLSRDNVSVMIVKIG
eukprot:Stramenopile-MAST_4_protein_1308